MRVAIYLMSGLLLSSAALPASFRDVARAVNDDQKLIYAGVEPEKVLVRRHCAAAILNPNEGADSFDCVFVQTEAVYQWLVEQGVPPRSPRPWLGR